MTQQEMNKTTEISKLKVSHATDKNDSVSASNEGCNIAYPDFHPCQTKRVLQGTVGSSQSSQINKCH